MERLLVGVILVAILTSCTRSERVAEVPECTRDQLLGYAPGWDEVTAHRQFSLPFVSYAFDTKRSELWGLTLTLRVDRSGRVACYQAKGNLFERDSARPLTAQARAAIDNFRSWHYAPFVRDGQPVDAEIGRAHV